MTREVRERLGLKQGDTITLMAPQEDNPFDTFIGTLSPPPRDARTFWREMCDG